MLGHFLIKGEGIKGFFKPELKVAPCNWDAKYLAPITTYLALTTRILIFLCLVSSL